MKDDMVSVETEEPPVGKKVICFGTNFHGEEDFVLTSRLAGNRKEGWKYTHSCFYVTHWTELPEKPSTRRFKY